MGCCYSKQQEQIIYKPLSTFPKLSNVWRTYNYYMGYICPTCNDTAVCKYYIALKCSPSDHFIKDNEWHHHCVQKRKIITECSHGHLSTHLIKTACECGWVNSEELVE
jgi:hypothetical protein